MLKFEEFINENKSYSFSFVYNNKKMEFKNSTIRKNYEDIINWLSKNTTGLEIIKKEIGILTYDELKRLNDQNPSYRNDHFFNISDTNLYTRSNAGFHQLMRAASNLLQRFGVEKNTIEYKIEGVDDADQFKKSPDVINKFQRINPPISKFSKRDRAEPVRLELKNPFGCKQNNGKETSALCILGKSGSGKTVTTENALDSMGHEYYLYIPIEGEYTFTQYTGTSFELSSIGEFILQAKNDPTKFYTLIFDEAHRPFTINKLNFDLLQALSSERNRDGQRFFTMDKITKRMFTNPNPEEFETGLIESRGKVLVPDNFGIVLLSSNMSIIPRNPDLFNRVDIVLFKEEFRKCEDLTRLKKLEPNQKNEDFIEQFFLNQEV